MTAQVSAIGSRGMILAAGLGKRMRPLTLTRPKPMIEVAGKPLIAYAVDALTLAGTEQVVVNVHHFALQIEDWCKTVATPKLVISDEREAALETGGGIQKALPLLGPDPFFVLNGDGFWVDAGEPALRALRAHWRDDDMDCLLLVCPMSRTTGFDGRGDFVKDDAGRLTRLTSDPDHAMVYIGGYLVHPRLFEGVAPGPFSMNRLWDVALARGRLFGLEHRGHWFHVGTPEAIDLAEQGLRHLALHAHRD